ncbi:MAG: asparagine synthase (glutamine-hydrolyzing) [Anaerohalosphaeraceae bacterium]
MCGIAGFNWQDETLVRKLGGLLHHRGPEQEGYYVGGGVSLGHKRLCILDLSTQAVQPMFNEDGTVCVVFNGEIFNFAELRRELEGFGHRFVSHSDTEVLVHGYEQWGAELVGRLNGQFAFCIFDRKREQLFLARDRMGIKPLYLYAEAGKFMFGSEMKVLMEGGVPKTIDSEALAHYWLFGYTTGRRSILQHVRQLLPGHLLVYDLKNRSIQREEAYWQLRFDDRPMQDTPQLREELVERLERSVKMQMISDVPLGAFLSGGVDSSILVALMTKHKQQLKTFSVRFDYSDFNESHWAELVARQFGTEHHEIPFNAEDVRKLIPTFPDYYDEPYADSSMIPTYLVCTVARQHVTVALSGTGGDELFAGYPRYREFGILRNLNHLAGPVRKILDCSVGAVNRIMKSDKLNKLRLFLQQPLQDYQLYPMLLSYMFRTKDEASRPDDAWFEQFKPWFAYPCRLNNLLNMDIQHYLPDDLLVKEDRASMAVSLEVRVPMLDHEFVEFSSGLPAHLKLSGGKTKYILKKAFEGILPSEVLYRPKRGFGVPLVHYFRKELRQFTEEIVFDSRGQEFLDRKTLEQYWRRHQEGLSDYSRIFWSVMMYKLWYNRWMA